MSEDLDLRSIDQSHEPDPRFRAQLRRRLEDEVQGTTLSDPRADRGPVELEPAPPRGHRSTSDGRRTRAAVIGAVAAAAAIAPIVAVPISVAWSSRAARRTTAR